MASVGMGVQNYMAANTGFYQPQVAFTDYKINGREEFEYNWSSICAVILELTIQELSGSDIQHISRVETCFKRLPEL